MIRWTREIQREERMSINRAKYDEEFKKNAVKLSHVRPKSVTIGLKEWDEKTILKGLGCSFEI